MEAVAGWQASPLLIYGHVTGFCKRSIVMSDNIKEYHEKALVISKAIGDKEGEAAEYGNLGTVFHSLGEYHNAKEYHEKALVIRKAIGDRKGQATCYGNLGTVFHSLGEYLKAKEYHEKALVIRKAIGDRKGEATCYGNLGTVFHSLGEYLKAKEHQEKALVIRKAIGDTKGEARCYGNLGTVFYPLGEYLKAKECHKKALVIRKAIGDTKGEAADFENLGIVFYSLGEYLKAKEYHEKALVIRKAISDTKGEAADYGNLDEYLKEETTKCGMREGHLSDLQEPAATIQFPLKRGDTGAMKDEGVLPEKVKESQLCTTTISASGIITSQGGMVKVEDVQLVCPPGAVDNPVSIKITLEDPVKYYGLIVQRGLQNDVMFAGPVINLQPNGHLFKKPVTLTTKIKIEEGKLESEEVLVLHGTEARDGKISWQDITQNAIINVAKKEVRIEVRQFSVIANLLTVARIRIKEVVSRLNLFPFNYTMSVLFKEDSSELALVFMSQDIFHEPYYVEHDASALVQLGKDGFRLVRSIDGPIDKRIYNSEDLQVSVHLGEDYELSDNQQSSLDVTVESHVWWNTGRVIKLPLKVINDVSILCGRISVRGQYGHSSESSFSEQDLRGYVRCLLGVEGAIFNLLTIAEKLGTPEGLMTQITNSWKDDNEQLEILLQPWLKKNGETKDPDSLKKNLEDLKEEDYKVTQRGQMHIRNLRELAVKISDLKIKNAELTTYFSGKIQDLCKTVLKDCCIELASSVEDVERVASYQSYENHLEIYPEISKDTASKYEQMCRSSSEESMAKHFLSIVPHLIQDVKAIFRDEMIPGVQNGLRGLHKETLDQLASDVREAGRNNNIRQLVCELCTILENLCVNNRDSQHSAELIRKWGSSLGVFSMLELLKPFFQKCPQDVRLHKRLERFSCHIKGIVSDAHVDEVFVRDFFDVSLTLIHFAKFDPAKLVRFELIDSTNHRVTCKRDSVEYDRDSDTYSQVFFPRKESEVELLLHAVARVHSKGQVGAFQSVFTLSASAEEAFDKCMTQSVDVAVIKLKVNDSQDIRVVLCSTQKEKLSLLVDDVLKRELREEVVDWKGSQITPCHLTMRALATKPLGTVLTLRLVYKWESEAVFLDSKDFVAHADSSAERACTPEVKLVGPSDSLKPEEAALALLPWTSDDGNFLMETFGSQRIQTHTQIRCEKIEYHLHQTSVTGHNCMVEDQTTINALTPTTSQWSSTASLHAMTQEHGQPHPSVNKLRVTILASEWGSSKGGLSTINRELAIQLAKCSEVQITFFVPQCSEEDKRAALSHNIDIVKATRRAGYDELDWLSFPPDDLQIDVIVGHGVKLGRQAQVIRESHKCKWIQVVHTDPEELGMFKSYENPISTGEKKHKTEVELCEMADFVVGVGAKLSEAFRTYLRWCKKDKSILDITPGVFDEFVNVEPAAEDRKRCGVLVFGRGDAEDFQLKGFDIAGKAVAEFNNAHLVFVGAPEGKHEEIAKRFLECGIPANRLSLRGFLESRESLKRLFCEVDLVLMPSRTEGFGLTGLEALSAGLPVLVTKNSGFGKALSRVPFGSSCVIDSEDAKKWAKAITEIWNKDRATRLQEAEVLRTFYEEKYSWAKQSKGLVTKMISIVDDSSVDCRSSTQRKGESSLPSTIQATQKNEN